VLSEIPEAWAAAIGRWRALRRRQVPSMESQAELDPNDEMLIYQTLVGVWPLIDLDDGA
jgi:(1->4)-alpha-D-glucan 1-alpha-D-glucosylmutase